MVFLIGSKGPSTLAVLCCLPGLLSREVDQIQSGQYLRPELPATWLPNLLWRVFVCLEFSDQGSKTWAFNWDQEKRLSPKELHCRPAVGLELFLI